MQIDLLYLSINGTIDSTLTSTKFREIFEKDALKKYVDASSDEELTEQAYKDIETDLAKILNPKQTSEMMQILREINTNTDTAVVRFFAFQF